MKFAFAPADVAIERANHEAAVGAMGTENGQPGGCHFSISLVLLFESESLFLAGGKGLDAGALEVLAQVGLHFL